MSYAVNQNVREAIILELFRKRLTRRQLAEMAEMDETYLSRLLSGDREGGRAAWEKILDVLGLELTAKPKQEMHQ